MTEIRLRCLAIDDEPFALKLISEDIGKVSFLQLTGTCSTAMEARAFLENNEVDLIFLDIQMPEITGIQFLKSLVNSPMVIITTAYEQYAIDGFELEVVDYLMKPIPFERFLKAVTRAKVQSTVRSLPGTEKNFLFVHSEYKEIRIDTTEIEYIEGLKDYIKIFLTGQTRPILTRMNLKAVEQHLPSETFCRVHNSYIVSLPKISSFQKSQLFIGKRPLPIGDKYADAFLKKYKKD